MASAAETCLWSHLAVALAAASAERFRASRRIPLLVVGVGVGAGVSRPSLLHGPGLAAILGLFFMISLLFFSLLFLFRSSSLFRDLAVSSLFLCQRSYCRKAACSSLSGFLSLPVSRLQTRPVRLFVSFRNYAEMLDVSDNPRLLPLGLSTFLYRQCVLASECSSATKVPLLVAAGVFVVLCFQRDQAQL